MPGEVLSVGMPQSEDRLGTSVVPWKLGTGCMEGVCDSVGVKRQPVPGYNVGRWF